MLSHGTRRGVARDSSTSLFLRACRNANAPRLTADRPGDPGPGDARLDRAALHPRALHRRRRRQPLQAALRQLARRQRHRGGIRRPRRRGLPPHPARPRPGAPRRDRRGLPGARPQQRAPAVLQRDDPRHGPGRRCGCECQPATARIDTPSGVRPGRRHPHRRRPRRHPEQPHHHDALVLRGRRQRAVEHRAERPAVGGRLAVHGPPVPRRSAGGRRGPVQRGAPQRARRPELGPRRQPRLVRRRPAHRRPDPRRGQPGPADHRRGDQLDRHPGGRLRARAADPQTGADALAHARRVREAGLLGALLRLHRPEPQRRDRNRRDQRPALPRPEPGGPGGGRHPRRPVRGR